MEEKIFQFLIYYPIFLISLIVHEVCHGLVALKKGDPTAKYMGRLTLNPLSHMDPVGTVIFPILDVFTGFIPFAWAKPVPVNPMNFKNRTEDMFWVALAGPASNFVLAFFAAWIYGMTVKYGQGVFSPQTIHIILDLSKLALILNLALFTFNLLPISPLDGSKIIGRFLPYNIRHVFEELNPMYGMMILLALFMTGLIRLISIPIFALANLLLQLFRF